MNLASGRQHFKLHLIRVLSERGKREPIAALTMLGQAGPVDPMTQGRYQLRPSIFVAVISLGPCTPPLQSASEGKLCNYKYQLHIEKQASARRGDCVVFSEVPNETTGKISVGLYKTFP